MSGVRRDILYNMEVSPKNVLETNEQIVWQGAQNRGVLIFFLVLSLVIVLGVGVDVMSISTISYTSLGGGGQISGAMIGWGIIIIGVFFSLLSFFQNFVREYVVTQKRILLKSGIIGTDFESVYFTQIKNLVVNVGLIDKIFSVGTIKIDTGKTETYSTPATTVGNSRGVSEVRTRTMYSELKHIDAPYDVYKNIQEALSGRVESL